jgi:hypothetical protein
VPDPSDANLPGGKFGKDGFDPAAVPPREQRRNDHFRKEIAFVPPFPQLHVHMIVGLRALPFLQQTAHHILE